MALPLFIEFDEIIKKILKYFDEHGVVFYKSRRYDKILGATLSPGLRTRITKELLARGIIRKYTTPTTQQYVWEVDLEKVREELKKFK